MVLGVKYTACKFSTPPALLLLPLALLKSREDILVAARRIEGSGGLAEVRTYALYQEVAVLTDVLLSLGARRCLY